MTSVLLGRAGAEAAPGGDALQIDETAGVLRGAGHDVAVVSSAAEARARLSPGATVHLFNVQRAPDWGELHAAAERGHRVLITPLFHPLARYHQDGRAGADGLVARLLRDADRFSSLRYGGRDLVALAREALDGAEVLLSAPAEADLLRAWCGARLPRTHVVPPGVPELRAEPVARPFERDFVLSVGRIEPLKHPIATLEAAAEAGLPVAFVGALPPRGRHLLYTRRFLAAVRALGRRRARWLGPLPAPQVRGLMEAARLHALASWTEVLGRSTVEAAMHGAAVVLSDVGHAPGLLGPDPRVFPVEPGDSAALRRAMRRAWEAGRDPGGPLARRARERLGWSAVAPSLLRVWGAP